MKAIVTCGLAVAALTLCAPSKASAWENEYVQEGLDNCLAVARRAGKVSGYGLKRGGFSVLGTWLNQGDTAPYSLPLESRRRYIFIGAGDRDVQDLDLRIESEHGEVVEDTATDATPIVEVTVDNACQVTATLNCYRASDAPNFCCMIILEERGQQGSIEMLHQAATELNNAATGAGSNYNMWTNRGSFSLFGGIMANDEEQGMYQTFDTGGYMIVGWADNNAQDLDMRVVEEGREVCADRDTDATPVCNFTVNGSTTLEVYLKMYRCSRPSFGIACILEDK